MISPFPTQILVLVVFCFFTWYFIQNSVSSDEKNQCIMSWMYPNYIPVENIFKSPNYDLYYYVTGRNKMEFGSGIPVLFVHGNAGKYKQVRSVGQYASLYDSPPTPDPAVMAIRSKLEYDKLDKHLDFFTIDFKSEFSAFSAELLYRQADYVNHTLTFIAKSYPRDWPIIVIGHSMGGLMTRSVLHHHPNVKLVFHLSSPIVRHPLPLNYDMYLFYYNLQKKMLSFPSRMDDVVEVSISGGYRDNLINYDQTLLPSDTYTTYEIPGVRISCDHQAIVWCGQVVQTLSNILLEVVNTEPSLSSSDEIRKILDSHLKSKFVESQMYPKMFFNISESKFESSGQESTIHLEVKQHPFVRQVKDFSKSHEIHIGMKRKENNKSKKRKKGSDEEVYFISNLKKNVHFDVFGVKSSRKKGHPFYYPLNEFVEVLPYVRKGSKHREIREYPSNIPQSIFVIRNSGSVGSVRKFSFDSIIVRFKKETMNDELYGVVNQPEFIISVDKYRKRSHEERFTFFQRMSLLTPASREIAIAQTNIFALDLFGPDLSLPLEVKVHRRKKKKKKCMNSVVLYWLKNEDMPSQSRMLLLDERAEKFDIKFSPDDLPLGEKSVRVMIFSDPRCPRSVEKLEIRVSWSKVFSHALKFEVSEFIKVLFSGVLFSLVRLLVTTNRSSDDEKRKKKESGRRSKSSYFFVLFLDNFWVLNIVMLCLRMISKQLIGSNTSFVYTSIVNICSLSLLFVTLICFSVTKMLIRKLRLSNILLFIRKNVLVFLLGIMILLPSIGYIIFFMTSIIVCLAMEPNSTMFQNQFNEGIALLYMITSIFNVFPTVTSFTSWNLSWNLFRVFYEIPFFVLILHGNAQSIKNAFGWSDKIEFLVNALAFLCLLVEDRVFIVYYISLGFFLVLTVLSVMGDSMETKEKEKQD